MSDPDLSDGGPAFPCDNIVERDARGYLYGTQKSGAGMSKRELFAVILMHAEFVTGGPNSENASRAVAGADELLLALSEPTPVQYRDLYPGEQRKVNDAIRLATLVEETKSCPQFLLLPSEVRERLERASQDVLDPEIPF